MKAVIATCLGCALLGTGTVRAWGTNGEEVVSPYPALADLLKAPKSAERFRAASVLVDRLVPDEEEARLTKAPDRRLDLRTLAATIRGLTEALGNTDREVRFFAACLLVRFDPANEPARKVVQKRLPALLTLLKEGDPERACFAARTLACLGADATEAIPALFHREIPDRRFVPIRTALEAIGPAAIPFYRKVLKEGDESDRGQAIALLARIGPRNPDPVLPILTEALGDEEPANRLAAAVAIVKLDSRHHAAGRILTRAARDDDKRIRRRALWALGRRAEVWLEVLRDTDPDCRLAADEVLFYDHPPCGRALHTEAFYRKRASEALAAAAPNAATIVPGLTEALGNEDREVRFHAACALVRIDPENEAATERLVGELPALIDMLGASDGNDIVFAANVLGGMGPRAQPAVPALVAATRHPRQWANPGMAAELALMKIRPGWKPD